MTDSAGKAAPVAGAGGETSTGRALREAIWDEPHDDAPRLVYADWLEEHGDPDQVARAEFIRVQCELARLDEDDPRAEGLRKREQKLLRAHTRAWKAGLPGFLRNASYHRGFLLPPAQNAGAGRLLNRPESDFALAPLWRFFLKWTPGSSRRLAKSSRLLRIGWLELPLRMSASLVADLVGSPNVRNVCELSLSPEPDEREEGVRLLAETDKLPRPRSLWLAWPHSPDLARLARAPFAAGLTALGGSYCRVDDDSLEELARSPLAQGLRDLRLHTVQGTTLTDAGVGALLRSPAADTLRSLDLSGWRSVTDSSAEALASSPRLNRLYHLRLAGTSVGPAGAWALAESPHLPALQRLVLPQFEPPEDLRSALDRRFAWHRDSC